jgi:regulator of sigma E protease
MFLSIIVAILILGFLIISHEFGHFIVAKKSGIKVEEFGIGYPPRIWGIKKGETTYSINAIPFGGFVRLYGEDEQDEKHLKDPRSFNAKPITARALTISAGVIMNFLVAVVIFYFLLPFSGFASQQYLVFNYHFPFGEQQNFPLISFVAKNSPAEKAGLEAKSVVLSGNGIKFKDAEQFVKFTNNNKGEKIFLKTKDLDTGEINEINVVPRINPPAGEGPLGIGLGDMAEIRYGTVLEKTTVGFLHSFNLAHYSVTALGHLIAASFEEKSVKPLSSSVVGPVGILAITKLTLKAGIPAVLNLIALISLALVVVNIIPFPALDGGRLLFIAFEGIFKKRVPQAIERNANLVGFVFLILLLVLVTVKDVSQFGGMLF